MRVGLGVDGSASNERSHLFNDVKQALLVARGRGGPQAMTAREALRLGTRGGAEVLAATTSARSCRASAPTWRCGRRTGSSSAARPTRSPGWSSPAPHRVDRLYVGGELVVQGGALVRADEGEIARAHRAQAV